jgi:hypothetical protein
MGDHYSIIIIVILLILIYIVHNKKETFAMPSDKSMMYKDIINNKNHFVNKNYKELKALMPWMDAGIYYDVRQLIRNNEPINFDTLPIIFRRDVI